MIKMVAFKLYIYELLSDVHLQIYRLTCILWFVIYILLPCFKSSWEDWALFPANGHTRSCSGDTGTWHREHRYRNCLLVHTYLSWV